MKNARKEIEARWTTSEFNASRKFEPFGVTATRHAVGVKLWHDLKEFHGHDADEDRSVTFYQLASRQASGVQRLVPQFEKKALLGVHGACLRW